jgi:hypothetical protein
LLGVEPLLLALLSIYFWGWLDTVGVGVGVASMDMPNMGVADIVLAGVIVNEGVEAAEKVETFDAAGVAKRCNGVSAGDFKGVEAAARAAEEEEVGLEGIAVAAGDGLLEREESRPRNRPLPVGFCGVGAEGDEEGAAAFDLKVGITG